MSRGITKMIRITEEQEMYLLSTFKNCNAGIRICIDKYMRGDESNRIIQAVSRQELRGKFTYYEWLFFLGTLNGCKIEGTLRCSWSVLVIHCERVQEHSRAADKYMIDLDVLIKKIRSLSGAQIDAIYSFVEEFWADPKRKVDKYATFLL